MVTSRAPAAAPGVVEPVAGSGRRAGRAWTGLAAVEVALATAAILLDLAVPALILLMLAGGSMLVRRQGPASLGLHRAGTPWLAVKMLLFAAVWSIFQLAVTMPVASHLSGREQDMGVFADVEGDPGLLVLLVALSWTLGALCEEIAYRGYLLTRLRDVLGSTFPGLAAAVVFSSVLFGVSHSEQGIVGVAMVGLDAVAFCVLRLRYDTVWAPVLAHGWNNTLGLVTFFLVGPVYALW